ncbi:glycosyltransferase [Aliarcobacter cryaerophilus]|uniref:glycosyltransferase n=1 Tax=Aliarcobacter cryaerophilus TaxID=28198 RepID=UPI0021B6A519|nr:glycosyltransferase [Aliarcobacter cryaerophilus]MCT7405752.1 glycosyltransferase [Aliarcobacter cryaerophilus]MCT7503305.1 glycosyltransferase [Aliarcobacter cryaerophilus]
MSNLNIHIYPSPMTNESRIFKESRFLSKNYNFDKIILLGIWQEGLKKEEALENNIYIKRVSLFNVKKRSIMYLYYYLYVFLFIIFKRPKMINIHTLEFLPLALIAKIFRIKVIYDAHELETEKANFKGFRKNISKIIERIFIKFTHGVIVVGDAIADHYKKMYPSMERPFVVLNTPSYKEITKKDLFRENFNIKKEQIIFLYQGALSQGRGIEIILDTFKNRKDKNSVIVFMGYGALQDEIINITKVYKNIFFQPAVPHNIILDYTSSADVGISGLVDLSSCLSYYYSLPNKIFEYLMAELPIIVPNAIEMKNFVLEKQVGVVLNENNCEELNKAINYMIEIDRNKFHLNIINTKNTYNWEFQEKVLMKLYNNLDLNKDINVK